MLISLVRFEWTNELISLKKCLQEFKSPMEFGNCDSNAGKVKLYESVRKRLTEIYHDEQKSI